MNTDTEQEWRGQALNAALRAAAYSDEDGGDVLLLAVRRHCPTLCTLKLSADRPQLVEFLERSAEGCRSLLPAEHVQKSDDQSWPYVGWYAVESDGAAIEVVLPPGWVGGQALCLCQDETALHAFADRLNRYVISPAGRCLRYDSGWENAPDIDAELDKVTWDDVVLRPDILDGVRRTVQDFFTQRDAFRALGFAWKRGLLLIGPPGTGKTMICKAAAASLPDLPFLYVRDLQGGREVKAIFDRARQLAPCILAFEDVDGLVNKANRSVFLNEMDGFQSNDGIFVIASSNHPGKIDEALLKRPSRFDRVFHVGLPGPDERQEYCRRLLARPAWADRLVASLDVDDLAHQVAERTDGFTPAYLKEAFLSAALLRAQEGETRLDELFGVTVLEQVDELRAHLKRMKDPDALSDMQSGGGAMSLRR